MKTAIFGIAVMVALASSLEGQAVPAPDVTGTSLSPVKTEAEGATRTDCKFNHLAFFPATAFLLAPDGKFVYVCSQEGVIQKVSLPDFTEERRLATARSLGPMSLSREGLVLLTGQKKEGLGSDPQLWILDPDSLVVRKTLKTEVATALASSPDSGMAVSAAGIPKGADSRLLVTDLKSEKAPREISNLKLMKESAHLKKTKLGALVPPNWGELKFSPGSKYLFHRGNSSLCRLEFKGGDVAYEEVGPPMAFIGSFTISFDAKLVAVTAGKGMLPKDHPKPGEMGVYVYSVDNLQKPAVSIPNAEFLAFGKDNSLIV